MSKDTDQLENTDEYQRDEVGTESSGVDMSGLADGTEDDVEMERFSPGAALSKAREQLGVSLETIAEKTAIPIAKLKLLENDNFDQLGAELFVIGYLKKYAVILNLPENELISDYRSYRTEALEISTAENAGNVLSETHGSSLSKSSSGLAINTEIRDSLLSKRNMFYSESSSRSLFKRSWFWLVVIVVLCCWGAYEMFFGERAIINPKIESSVLVSPISTGSSVTIDENLDAQKDELVDNVVEVQNNDFSTSNLSKSQLIANKPKTDLNNTTNSNPSVSNVLLNNSPEAVAASNNIANAADSFDLPANTLVTEEPVTEELVTEPVPNGSVFPVTTRSDSSGDNLDSTSIDKTLNKSVAEAGSVKLDRLDIDFNDDCWLEVTDSSGEVSIAKLQRGGDNLRLFGVAPFTVKLGNARAAQLHINSRLFEIPLSGNRRTTKFSVYKQSENDI